MEVFDMLGKDESPDLSFSYSCHYPNESECSFIFSATVTISTGVSVLEIVPGSSKEHTAKKKPAKEHPTVKPAKAAGEEHPSPVVNPHVVKKLAAAGEDWKLARSASGAGRGYREFARIAQGSSPEEDRDSSKDFGGSRKLQPDNGPRSSLGISPGSDDAVGFCREFARRFTERIGKLAGNTLGDHREMTGRLGASMSEAIRLAKVRS
ncbi:hypothetical protein BHM03_00009642 [Ensete ventricosum]|nr:hypothetical protein BHM03_00009642 [Ensete ventricosum]